MRVSNNTNKDVDVSGVAHTKKHGRVQTNSSNGPDATAGTGIADSAKVEISGEAKAISQANKLARADDVDQAKIDKVKAAINNGTYKPDYGKVADRVINEQLTQELT